MIYFGKTGGGGGINWILLRGLGWGGVHCQPAMNLYFGSFSK